MFWRWLALSQTRTAGSWVPSDSISLPVYSPPGNYDNYFSGLQSIAFPSATLGIAVGLTDPNSVFPVILTTVDNALTWQARAPPLSLCTCHPPHSHRSLPPQVLYDLPAAPLSACRTPLNAHRSAPLPPPCRP